MAKGVGVWILDLLLLITFQNKCVISNSPKKWRTGSVNDMKNRKLSYLFLIDSVHIKVKQFKKNTMTPL